MRYCRSCILPDTRPHLRLDGEGVCNACRSHGVKRQVDWAGREQAFRGLVADVRARTRGYDCVIPVSGGKDSHWQVIRCLEYGMTPLAVTWRPPARTGLGQRNLENLIRLGVDHIDYSIRPEVERRFSLAALERFGSPAIAMHMAIFHIPLTVAVRFGIPLVVWGENSAAEYGGDRGDATSIELNADWVRKYGVTQGTTAKDWVGPELTERDLAAYFGPTEPEMLRAGVRGVFLGSYFPWDPQTSLAAAKARGFEVRAEGPLTGYYNYADVDDPFVAIHHWLKWHKFGLTRTWDNLSLEIRNGRMNREEAVRIVRERGDETPHEAIGEFCRFAGIARARFDEIVERFRNPAVWVRRDGRWTIEGFLIPDWTWT